jgi:hypothetical protein
VLLSFGTDYQPASLAHEDYSGRYIPRVVAKDDRCVHSAVSEPGKVDGRGTEHPHSLNLRS